MLRYILDRKQAFPNSPLPSSSWVRKTFDDCVADPRDMECKYPQVGAVALYRLYRLFLCRAALEGLRTIDARAFSSAATTTIVFPSIQKGQTNLQSVLWRNTMPW